MKTVKILIIFVLLLCPIAMGQLASLLAQIRYLAKLANRPPNYNPNNHIRDTVLDLNPENYDGFGNYHLERIDEEWLAGQSLILQMNYSDAITRRYAKNPLFLKQQITEETVRKIDRTPKSVYNQAAIGNSAFILYHNPDNELARIVYDKLVTKILYMSNDHICLSD